MKRSTEDKAKGKLHEVKGELVEKVGKLVGDPILEERGEEEKKAGKAQTVVGKIEDVFGG